MFVRIIVENSNIEQLQKIKQELEKRYFKIINNKIVNTTHTEFELFRQQMQQKQQIIKQLQNLEEDCKIIAKIQEINTQLLTQQGAIIIDEDDSGQFCILQTVQQLNKQLVLKGPNNQLEQLKTESDDSSEEYTTLSQQFQVTQSERILPNFNISKQNKAQLKKQQSIQEINQVQMILAQMPNIQVNEQIQITDQAIESIPQTSNNQNQNFQVNQLIQTKQTIQQAYLINKNIKITQEQSEELTCEILFKYFLGKDDMTQVFKLDQQLGEEDYSLYEKKQNNSLEKLSEMCNIQQAKDKEIKTQSIINNQQADKTKQTQQIEQNFEEIVLESAHNDQQSNIQCKESQTIVNNDSQILRKIKDQAISANSKSKCTLQKILLKATIKHQTENMKYHVDKRVTSVKFSNEQKYIKNHKQSIQQQKHFLILKLWISLIVILSLIVLFQSI